MKKKTVGLAIGIGILAACIALVIIGFSSAPAVILADDTPQAHIPTVETPGPEVFNDPEYLKLAKYVGWGRGADMVVATANGRSDIQIQRNDFHQWLKEHQIAIYDGAKVETYLQKAVHELNNAESIEEIQAHGQYRLDWFPLEGRTQYGGSCVNNICSMAEQRVDYSKPIPKRVLQLMADVKDCFPAAHFAVSDIQQVKDPFLKVVFDWGTEVIAKWDEPSFN